MRKLILFLALFCLPVLAQSTWTNSQTITVSGNTITVTPAISMAAISFEEDLFGFPTSTTITIQGCTSGGSCRQVDTYTAAGNFAVQRSIASPTSHHFVVTATWSGGAGVFAAIGTRVTGPTPASSGAPVSVTGSVTANHLAVFNSSAGDIKDGGTAPVSPTTNQNIRVISAVLTPSNLTACGYMPIAVTINGFHATGVDGASNITALVKVETQATRATFLSTGVSGASDISNGGEQLTTVLGLDDITLTSWSTSLAAGTTVCLVASGFSAGSSVGVEVTGAAN